MPEYKLKNVCVFCASSNSVDQKYFQLAAALGEKLAEKDYALVYGGGSIGLMGETARAVHRHGGKVIGIIPKKLFNLEVGYQESDELIVTADMRERKAEMEAQADAFITLPGGFGTLEELLEIITGKQLAYHSKPIVILDVDGFYTPLETLFEHLFETKFARETYRGLYYFADSVDDAINYLENYQPADFGRKV